MQVGLKGCSGWTMSRTLRTDADPYVGRAISIWSWPAVSRGLTDASPTTSTCDALPGLPRSFHHPLRVAGHELSPMHRLPSLAPRRLPQNPEPAEANHEARRGCALPRVQMPAVGHTLAGMDPDVQRGRASPSTARDAAPGWEGLYNGTCAIEF